MTTRAVRYFSVPDDITVCPGIGCQIDGQDGGRMAFSRFFAMLMLGSLVKTDNEEAEAFLCATLMRCRAGEKVELPEAAWAALFAALPRDLATGNPDLYAELRPFVSAVRTAPSTKPADWGPPRVA